MNSAIQTMLDAWRANGTDRVDRVRFSLIEAMERRAASHTGEARRVLDEKLAKLSSEYERQIANASAPLKEENPGGDTLGHLAFPESPEYPQLESLDYFKALWTRLSAQKQLRQSLQQVPGNAGPLNSSNLVHRSLSLMHDVSPGYLQYFLSYVDALSRIEQIKGQGLAEKDVSRSASPGKKPKLKSR